MYSIGLDVHAAMTAVCVLDPHGKRVREFAVRGPLSEAVAAVKDLQKELGPLRVCYEASTAAGWLWDQLQGAGRKVLVAHPGKVRLIFRAKRKNDRIDAKKLATLCFLDQVPQAHIPTAARRQWRSLIEYRRRLVEKRGCVKNRLRALLRSHALQAPRSLWFRAGQEWLRKVDLGMCQSLVRDQLMQELQEVRQKIAQVEGVLKKLAEQEPAVRLLMTIPGVGIRTAEAVVAYIDEPSRFRRIKSVGCYFGMVPCEDTSVKSRLGHLTKEGPPTVRKYVTEAAWQAIRRDATIRTYFQRVQREDPKRRKIALVATAHHLLRVMLAMLRTGEEWNAQYPPKDPRKQDKKAA
jgi:transposase